MKAAQKAYNVIKARIIDGHFAPGDRITEAEIAETASVSRTPVREALHRLEAEGLIRFVPNQGAFVSSCGLSEAEETFELRAILESFAAKLCAERATPAQREELSQLAHAQMEVSSRLGPRGIKQIAELNEAFHTLVLNAADSDLLRATMANLANAPLVFQTFRDYSQEYLIRSAQHHLEFVEAVQQHNGEWAASVMRSHIFAARAAFMSKVQAADTGAGTRVSALP
ncbi:MAG: GntR family transcriptional regulator [Pseudomonadota bacterium]